MYMYLYHEWAILTNQTVKKREITGCIFRCYSTYPVAKGYIGIYIPLGEDISCIHVYVHILYSDDVTIG